MDPVSMLCSVAGGVAGGGNAPSGDGALFNARETSQTASQPKHALILAANIMVLTISLPKPYSLYTHSTEHVVALFGGSGHDV
jgi:hypothetical protein